MINDHDIFAAALSGDFNNIQCSEKELMLALWKYNYISEPTYDGNMLTGNVLIPFTYNDYDFNVDGWLRVRIEGGWNSEMGQKFYATFHDEQEQWDSDQQFEYAIGASEEYMIEYEYINRKWKLDE